MSALAILAGARDAGVRIAVDGDDLVLTAPAAPPVALVDLLAHHKAELVALLRPRLDDWSIKDWQAYFDERAGIIEFDGGFPRAEAEARAFECCVTEWLGRNPGCGPSERCLGCGGAGRGDDTLMVFGGYPLGAWLHSRCWEAWHAGRKAEAVAAISNFGISMRTSP